MISDLSIRLPREGGPAAHSDPVDLGRIRRKASTRRYLPAGTVRCVGLPLFRSSLAHDLGLLLDLDEEVEAWQCLPHCLDFADGDGVIVTHVPDFLVHYACGSQVFLDAGPVELAPIDEPVVWSAICESEIRAEPAISNAREMLRYARRMVPLGDRIRLIAHLEDAGSATLVDATAGMRESAEPIGAVIALVLQRVIRIDWGEKPDVVPRFCAMQGALRWRGLANPAGASRSRVGARQFVAR